ncbi:hypothetical protein ABAZ39_07365 [Azospirillum argentinense]|uniref:Uncharacterized protein n=1 Tax=Azospirillum argentinense TaxID=2970906 RepID=A0A060DLE0_9PROT|nr:hypothetical protein [Azospirillum argentinense]AIB11818.1 hypothetical protein ABAZ39_07365 [Azospirillum argentinense]EZQ09774.1 hypothetical protein ABAZ39_08780 [Azospirillum argentinense]
MTDTEWTLWSERRPEDTKALYRWRIPARMICGMMLRPEWSAKLQYCGMGYGPSEWWPEYSRWDGYVRSVPDGMEWRLAREGEDAESISWGGLDLLPCPHTGGALKVTYRGRWLHAGPWDAESLSIRAWMVNSCGWADANKMVANWNRRPETPAADQTEAIAQALEGEAARLKDEAMGIHNSFMRDATEREAAAFFRAAGIARIATPSA